MQDRIEPADGAAAANPTAKKLVIFADGTGSAFGQQESNIWRMYQALDKTQGPDQPLQIARYIQGVGTSSIGVLRYFDGATGLGVPSNVRKLYRFLCLNWRDGDEIYLFGFSRGAFTVRTLAALVARQGLMPQDVTRAEMDRNAMAAWRAYRKMTAPLIEGGWLRMNPLISVVRGLRDGAVAAKRWVLGQRQHAAVTAALPEARKPGQVPITFMGVFDTVEAYGLPVDELRSVVNWLIWPIQFRNFRCSPVVRRVRHALALDEERRSFYPLRFQQGLRPDGLPEPDLHERWFPGVHSDVGGGYPNDEIAFEPMLWMVDEVSPDLRFDQAALGRYRARLYPQAPINDSRDGLAMLYRYGPRPILAGPEFGGEPLVDLAAVRKILEGADGYAPLTLPAAFRVAAMNKSDQSQPGSLQRDSDAAAVIDRLIGLRRKTNWITIAGLVALVLPLIRSLYGDCCEAAGSVLSCSISVVTGAVSGAPGVILADWRYYLAVALLLIAVFWVNARMASKIRDASGRLWRVPPVPQAEGALQTSGGGQ
ncbi:DUF2235 domain-containing protein [Tabrizicola sp.]|uniref:DUF2235 domain-containing protein n=1 Tax=Tabrizicola sp. TaxID=2005166 RepID=UPI00286C80E4|nr:DUF2235 domain-containing protein [Tabrizicola sp.]